MESTIKILTKHNIIHKKILYMCSEDNKLFNLYIGNVDSFYFANNEIIQIDNDLTEKCLIDLANLDISINIIVNNSYAKYMIYDMHIDVLFVENNSRYIIKINKLNIICKNIKNNLKLLTINNKIKTLNSLNCSDIDLSHITCMQYNQMKVRNIINNKFNITYDRIDILIDDHDKFISQNMNLIKTNILNIIVKCNFIENIQKTLSNIKSSINNLILINLNKQIEIDNQINKLILKYDYFFDVYIYSHKNYCRDLIENNKDTLIKIIFDAIDYKQLDIISQFSITYDHVMIKVMNIKNENITIDMLEKYWNQINFKFPYNSVLYQHTKKLFSLRQLLSIYKC